MAELRTSLILNLAGNIVSRSRQYSAAIERMGASVNRSSSVMRRGVELAGRGVDVLGNRYTALITGGAAVATAREVVTLQRRFTRLGITADIAANEVEKLKRRIFELAQQPEIP